MLKRTTLAALVLLMGCSGAADDETDTPADGVDLDGDGALAAEDCDDNDAALNLDDSDGDGVTTCDGDCADDDASAYPGAAASEPSLCTVDADGDGYGDATLAAPYDAGTDCADDEASAYPGAEEVWYDGIDQDCLGDSDFDADQDGFDSDAHGGTDCDDTDATVNPDADDSLLGGDRNCDGAANAGISSADYTFIGETPGDRAGSSVALAGDVDGDGLADILVGGPRVDGDERDSGRAYLYLGSSLGDERRLELADADYIFVGEGLAMYNGIDVASAGDVDGDGLDDILIGQQAGFDAVTEAYLILGSSLSSPVMSLADADYTFVGETVNDGTGQVVAGAGDVDGDGLDDVMVAAKWRNGTSYFAGKVAVFLGASLDDEPVISMRDADYALVGRGPFQYVGRYIAPAGDVDDDGLADLLIGGSIDETDSRRIASYLVLGSALGDAGTYPLATTGIPFTGGPSKDYVGYGLTTAGDVDGDGRDDIVAISTGGVSGVAYVFLGSGIVDRTSLDITTADYALEQASAEPYSLRNASSAGDVDGDGLDDILVSSWLNNEAAPQAGKVFLVPGASLASETSITLDEVGLSFLGEKESDGLGWCMASGDANGDGLDDLLLGTYSGSDVDGGHAYLLFGSE